MKRKWTTATLDDGFEAGLLLRQPQAITVIHGGQGASGAKVVVHPSR